MSDLTRFRDYCREAAATDADPLWSQMADEVDRYLAGEFDEQQLGFEV